MTAIRPLAVALFAILSLALAAAAPAQTIYYDDFSGGSATDLGGTAPDIRPGTETWTANTILKADGTKSTAAVAPAFLPFTPLPGTVYSLSMDVDVTAATNTDDWFAIGFSPTNDTTGWHTVNTSVTAWMLNRFNDTSPSAFQTFLGPGTASAANHDPNPDIVGPLNMKVVLDTQPALWTVEWFVDDVSIRGPVAYAANPAISYVGFAGYNSTLGSVDNFTLATPVPEPASAALAAVGAFFLAAAAWRARRRARSTA